MPEGHTIHRLARAHNECLAGRPVRASSPQGRFAADAATVDGRTLERVRPYGKHLFYEYDGDAVVHVHLGLYGRFEEHPQPAPVPRGAVRLRMETDDLAVDLRGPTVCEVLGPSGRDAILARLGPDPLDPRADRKKFAATLARRTTPVGALLLDQSAVAGVGNAFRAEALHALALSPFRPASEVDPAALWKTLTAMLKAGVRTGAIAPRHVYKQTGLPCDRCGTPIESAELAARTIFYCPGCQA